MKRTFSPDVLAANPDLAAKLKSSKAQTPSGRGNGFVDDAQDYGKLPPADPVAHLTTATEQFLGLLNRFAPMWRGGNKVLVLQVREACRVLLEDLEREKNT